MKRGVLVGCGYFAGIHLEAWNRLRDAVRMEAVCDLDPSAAARRASQFGIPRTYGDYRQMFETERPGFVDIVTRPDRHFEVLRAAADLGITVLCQKPLAPTYEEAEAMVAYCESAGVRLMVNENWRWQAWYRELKRVLDSGVIGQPFCFSLRHRMQDGAGPRPYPRQPYFLEMPRLLLIETMIHFLDTARFLVGDLKVAHCSLRRVNPAIRGEDVVLMTLEGAGTLVGTIDGNRLAPPEKEGPVMGDARVEGTGGAVCLEGDGRIFIHPLNGDRSEHVYPIPTIGYRGDSAFQTLRHFLECLDSGAEFETHGREYLKTTALVFEGYRLAGW